jgi:hypothetical protein
MELLQFGFGRGRETAQFELSWPTTLAKLSVFTRTDDFVSSRNAVLSKRTASSDSLNLATEELSTPLPQAADEPRNTIVSCSTPLVRSSAEKSFATSELDGQRGKKSATFGAKNRVGVRDGQFQWRNLNAIIRL